ncbi:MAG: hypothetical protein JSS49_28560 [Planctomycetes bacterium]|nr:hypothetical protein [Planctomycetota bacterium]
MDSDFRVKVLRLLVGILALCPIARADDPDKGSSERQMLLKEMRAAVAAIKVHETSRTEKRAADMVAEPVFRYSDQQRQIRDATIWVWTVHGRPVALMKTERYGFPEPQPHWLFNVTSVTSDTLTVKWPFNREFVSKKPGMTFRPTTSAVDAVETKSGRLVQLKNLARRFSATMIDGVNEDVKTEMRLLTTPLFRYSSEVDEIIDGAFFGFSATGTNPDAIVAIQWQGGSSAAKCEFSVTGTTTTGLRVRLDDTEVWSQPFLSGRGQEFDTWTWFFSDRAE